MDTLSAAAFASKNTNYETAANPLAAQHFGGTVGQSNLRPGKLPLQEAWLPFGRRGVMMLHHCEQHRHQLTGCQEAKG